MILVTFYCPEGQRIVDSTVGLMLNTDLDGVETRVRLHERHDVPCVLAVVQELADVAAIV